MPVSIFEVTVREVCGTCNSGWMNDIDVEIEPVLVALANGQRQDIPAQSVAAFSRWASRVALLRTMSDRSSNGHASAALFHELYRTQLPPSGTIIRIGALPQLAFEGGSNGYAHGVVDDRHTAIAEGDPRSTVNLGTWGIGFLYVHVILSFPGRGRALANHIDSRIRRMEPRLVKVWPNRRRAVTVRNLIPPSDLESMGSMQYFLHGRAPIVPDYNS